jgi:integrase
MMKSQLGFGTQRADDSSVRTATLELPEIRTLGDLLEALPQVCNKKELPMLRSAAVKLQAFFGKPSNDILLGLVRDCREDFRDFLKARKHKPKGVRSYLNFRSILVRKATELGWTPVNSDLPQEWSRLVQDIENINFGTIVRYFARRGLIPADVNEKLLSDWVSMRVSQNHSYKTAIRQKDRLRRLLVKSGLKTGISLSRVQQDRYGIPLSSFPEPLRLEVEETISWKTAEFTPGRSAKARVGAVTANTLQHIIGRIYGFAQQIDGRGWDGRQYAPIAIATFTDCLNEGLLTRFVNWALTIRKVKGKSLKPELALLHAVAKQHPRYNQVSCNWFKLLIESIPEEPESEGDARKEAKFLPYETIAAIPSLIRAGRPLPTPQNVHKLAIQVRDELLMKWLTLLPWRQRNIRECRISGETPNLFLTKPSLHSRITVPEWAKNIQRDNPNKEFWLIAFSASETKMKRVVNGFLPSELVDLLEEYLTNHRKELVNGEDPGTLFLNEDGEPLSDSQIRSLVSGLTLRHGGRVVTPHLFRDIFAYMYLTRAPLDFLTLSKLLWHKNINVTIGIYGRRFNESAALARMEDVLAPVDSASVLGTAVSVSIDSAPKGADIIIDGAFVGSTPSTVHKAPGLYAVTVRKRGFADWTRKFTVSGGSVCLAAELDPIQLRSSQGNLTPKNQSDSAMRWENSKSGSTAVASMSSAESVVEL